MLTRLSHLLCFVLPLSTFSFLISGPHDALSGFAWTLPFWLVLLLDWWNPTFRIEQGADIQKRFFDGILYGLALLQLANIWLMLNAVSELRWETADDIGFGLINLVAIRFLVGTSSGTSGIVLAHELIHRPQNHLQQLGRLLLCSVCYEHFVITHKRGHHLSMGMPQDIATARLGESFHDYWLRIYKGHIRYAWQSELERLGISHQPWQLKLIHHQVLHGLVAELILLIMISDIFGWLAALMFLYQAFAAVRILETVNYFQHWGLEDERYGHTYGWVTDAWMSRFVLIGLSHHIGHHENEHRHFFEIAYSDQGPKLPYGYFVMNLWVKLNNASYQQMALRELERFQHSQHPGLAKVQKNERPSPVLQAVGMLSEDGSA